MLEAGQVLVLWVGAGLGSFAFDLASGGSITAAVLVAVMVVFGGLVASALTYLVSERILRPATALALASEPPTRPVVPGIGTRIYLAWEFGTAVAVGGTVVVAIAYLAGAGMSPNRMAATVIFLGVFALTVGLGTLLVAIRSVADPVSAMRGAMRRVEQGDTDVSVPVDDGSEVGLLQAGFNRMVAGLRERDRVRDLFGRHVGEEVARSALGSDAEMGGELRDAAILFVDIVGSTEFAAGRDPREVVETLNRFFGIVVEVVTLHGGWVNKFEGDAALCVFGAPTEHPDASTAALAAARSLSQRLSLELDGIAAAVGLSAGTVVAGNIGAAQRYEYTVIGDAVNEAARLTELAKSRPARVVASDSILRRASDVEARRWSVGEPVVLRGRVAATRVATPA
jgi:adenylate cyclase